MASEISFSLLLLSFHSFSSFVSQQLNAPFSTLKCYISHFARLQLIISYFNQITALIIPVLTTLLQLKFQNAQSPFTTHPKAMATAVVASLLHYLLYITLLRLHPRSRAFAVAAHHCLVTSGNAAVASLASVLLPECFAPVAYAVFGLISAAELLCFKRIAASVGRLPV